MAAKKIEKADRAKIFLPFDALKGFREALRQKEKIVVEKKVRSEEETDKLSYILLNVKKNMIVKVIYYDKDEYLEITGMVSKNDLVYKKISIVDKVIAYTDIYDIVILESN